MNFSWVPQGTCLRRRPTNAHGLLPRLSNPHNPSPPLPPPIHCVQTLRSTRLASGAACWKPCLRSMVSVVPTCRYRQCSRCMHKVRHPAHAHMEIQAELTLYAQGTSPPCDMAPPPPLACVPTAALETPLPRRLPSITMTCLTCLPGPHIYCRPKP